MIVAENLGFSEINLRKKEELIPLRVKRGDGFHSLLVMAEVGYYLFLVSCPSALNF